MDFHKLKLLFNTLRYLKTVQVYYRIFYTVKNWIVADIKIKSIPNEYGSITWNPILFPDESYHQKNKFYFLNQAVDFGDKIDWNYQQNGKLWCYNLNYFDFLNQKVINLNEAISLIKDYIKNETILKDGKEPYPISLRIMNWVKFLATNKTKDESIEHVLYNYCYRLTKNLEYHLLGNHLLENGFALFFGACYFQDKYLYKKSRKILITQLGEQILADGGHFELSPMYHQIILHRLLDCVHLLRLNFNWIGQELVDLLKEKATIMLSWLSAMTYENGDIPMVNDSAYGIAPTSKDLFLYAQHLNIDFGKGILKDSGYRKIKKYNYELLIDVGQIGASYVPAHAHADMLSFELYIDQKPFIVDLGTSTYEKNQLRQEERSTSSHNTICVDHQNQSQVWGGFRVAKRASITQYKEGTNWIEASHNGYKKIAGQHVRRVTYESNKILIFDSFTKENPIVKQANFHLHPNVEIECTENNCIRTSLGVMLRFESSTRFKIEIVPYFYAMGFNNRVESKKIKVTFKRDLITKVTL